MSEKPLTSKATLYDVVRAIEQSHRRIAVVVAEDDRLLGTLTDGDVRRCLLAGGTLDTPAVDAMNSKPVTAFADSSDNYVYDLLKRHNVMSLPLIDARGRFLRLKHLSDLAPEGREVTANRTFPAAVIMAGGEGMRLRPLTSNIPKPMIDIGGIPLLERQIHRLVKAGLQQVHISVNYLSHVIEDYFEDGSRFGIRIEYLRENKKMGTAGALSLLATPSAGPLLVMNGDVLTTSDFANLYNYHATHAADITISAVDYHLEIPYGVIESDGPFAVSLKEKPSQRFLCNAGIYAISPRVLAMIPADSCYDMTDLIRDCLASDIRVAVFPLHEYWSDIGNETDLMKARELFGNIE